MKNYIFSHLNPIFLNSFFSYFVKSILLGVWLSICYAQPLENRSGEVFGAEIQALMDVLRDGQISPEKRSSAFWQILRARHQPHVLIFLVDTTDSLEPSIQDLLFEQLASAKQESLPFLAAILQCGGENMRGRGLAALIKIGPASIPIMFDAMGQYDNTRRNAVIREEIVWALGEIGCDSPEVIHVLIHALKDDYPRVRGLAAQVLGKLGEKAAIAVPVLLELRREPQRDRSGWVQVNAAVALEKIGEYALSDLIEALDDRDSRVRIGAEWTLERLGKKAVPALLEALQNPHVEVRAKAAGILGNIGLDSVVPALVNALEDTDFRVRQKAAQALGKIRSGSGGATPALTGALVDQYSWVRKEAARALGNIGSDSAAAVPALIELLNDPNCWVRKETAEALGKIGSKALPALPALKKIIEDTSEPVRLASAFAVIALGQEDLGRDVLLSGIESPQDDIQLMSLRFLEELGPKGAFAVPHLNKLMGTRNYFVVEAAKRALAKIQVTKQE